MKISKGYSYDDVLLEPRRSNLESRKDPNLTSRVGLMPDPLRVPIISSPMDTVTEHQMATFMASHGALGVIHRYMDIGQQALQVKSVKSASTGGNWLTVGASIGTNGEAIERAKALIGAGVDLLVVDVAHGHSTKTLRTLESVSELPEAQSVSIMSGNVATEEAMRDSLWAGATILRVGIGAGSACTTRVDCGVGVPQLTAVDRARAVADDYPQRVGIVADGGVRGTGDIIKALAAGADAVMLGGMLSGYSVAPRPGEFRGMASRDALMEYKGHASVTEGASFLVPTVVDDAAAFDNLIFTLRQGFAYLGAADIIALRANARWIEVSPLSYLEGTAHFGKESL